MNRVIFIVLVIGVSAQAVSNKGVLSFNISSPEYLIKTINDSQEKVIMEGFNYHNPPGRPDLPAKVFTIALPPGAVVEKIEVLGERRELPGRYKIAPAPPILPLMEEPEIRKQIMGHYEKIREDAYSRDESYPEEMGRFLSKGGLRKYRLVDIVFYPFSYKAKSGRLYYTPFASVKIYFSQSPVTAEYEKLLFDTSMDEEASLIIYNWEQAKEWYRTANGHLAPGYLIITPTNELHTSLEPFRRWKEGLGFSVSIVTKEWINSNVVGIDIQQKIRNYLREHLSEYQYVLIVGSDRDIPMRRCVPFNNDPDSPWNDPLYSPIPADLYYAELTDPDDESWDSDKDGYYGEVYAQDFSFNPDDNPDYHADVHLGRIPWSTSARVSHICQKIIDFEKNTDLSYKKSSLLAGGVLFYENEDNFGGPRLDGADLIERLLNNGILERGKAVTLYEKSGLDPCDYSCTAPLNDANLIANWKNKGLFNEFNHGQKTYFTQKVWVWDDGDHIPENNPNEMDYPTILESSDAPSLDDDYPANGFLSSCLNAYPEASNNLGASLLYQGAVSMIASTRVSWSSQEEWNYQFFNKLLKDTSATHSRTGDAFDAARDIYGRTMGWWLNIYDFVLYGDPSLCHFGIRGGTPDISVNPDTLTFIAIAQDTSEIWVKNEGNGDLTVSSIIKSAPWVTSINPTSFTLSPGDSQAVEVVVNPEGHNPDTYYDNLVIASNDPDENPYYEPVKLIIQSMPDIAVNPDTLRFEKSKDTVSMWVKNEGNIELSISSITKTASWIISIDPVSFAVQPEDSQGVTVIVDASGVVPGVFYDSLAIVSNDPDENPYYEPVKLAIQSLPDIAVNPDTLKFKKSQDTASMWVKNEGNAELSVSNITKAASWITSIDPVSFTVQPGDSQRVEVIADVTESTQDSLYTLLEIISNDFDESPYYQPVMLVPFLIVYPGDTDNNGIVDGRDVLPIGRYWRLQGPSRGDPSTDWGPKSATPWLNPAATYADCNGDGIIDGRDVLPIGRNWRKTHTSSGPNFAIDLTDPELKSCAGNFQEIYASLQGNSEAVQEIKELLLEIVKPVPKSFRLYQSYPNPFYEKTLFKFEIPEKSRVSLRIYNCAGELVSILTEDVYEPGYHQILWKRNDNKGRWVASGVYFCRAVMQPISPVRKVLPNRTSKREGFRTLKKMVILERRKK